MTDLDTDLDRAIALDDARDQRMSTPPINDIWKDPNVKQALKQGRRPEDIMVICCPRCNRFGYYNEGSHFSCRFCLKTWHLRSENETGLGLYLPDLDVRRLDDTITVTTDGYDNETLDC